MFDARAAPRALQGAGPICYGRDVIDARKFAPRPLRLAAFAVATGVLLYLCLAPAEQLPQERLWDKAEHGLAWAALTGLGLFLFPASPRAIAGFTLALGALVEALQSTLPLGRQGDLLDLVADSVGVGLALAAWRLLRQVGRR
jgi:VanZ family protein